MDKPQAKGSLSNESDASSVPLLRSRRIKSPSGDSGSRAAEPSHAARILSQSEAYFRQFAEASADVLWIIDLQAQQLEYLSPAFEVVWGEPRDAVMARLSRWAELVHPQDRKRAQRAMAHLLAGELFTLEYRIVRASDGAIRWIRDTGFPIFDRDGGITRVGGIAQDVTERKAVERSLAESEARFRQFADASPDVLWIRDAATLAMEYVSPAFEQVYGVARECVLGDGDPQRWTALMEPEDRQASMEHLERLRAGEHVTHVFRIRRPSDRRVRWIRNTDFALRDGPDALHPDGRIVRIGGIGQDVTELKRSEQALHEADRRKDEFLAMLAHELRNPLAPLTNAHRLLERTEPLTERGLAALALAQRQTQQLRRLVDDLLEISRITRGKIEIRTEPMSVGAAVHAAIESVLALTEQRAQSLAVHVPPEPLRIQADAVRFAQVLENLLTNASKYTPEGGAIRVEVESQAGAVEIRVVDNGVGIEPAKIGQLFEVFHQIDATIDRAQGGLGIGLALVKQLVELHGGTVRAESAGRDQGSTFTVRLPHAAAGQGVDR